MKGPNDVSLTADEECLVEKMRAEIEKHNEKGGRFPIYFDADEKTPMRVLRAVLKQAIAAGWKAEIKPRTTKRDSIFIYGAA